MGKRVVQAVLLRRCCHELKDQIDPRGLAAEQRGRHTARNLDLARPGRCRSRFTWTGCGSTRRFLVEGAELFELSLTGCPRLPGLLGNGLRLRRDLVLTRFRIAGAHWTSASTSKRAAVWLCESEIGGRLICLDATIDAQGERAIQADRIAVGGAVRLIHRFTARGEMRSDRRAHRRLGEHHRSASRCRGRTPAIDLGGATVAGQRVRDRGPPPGERPCHPRTHRHEQHPDRSAGSSSATQPSKPAPTPRPASIYARSTADRPPRSARNGCRLAPT